mgnify:CR=1 FL=1
MARKKRKLKKNVKLFLCVFLIIFSGICIASFGQNETGNKKNVKNLDYVSSILSYDNNIFEEKFLIWIDDNYNENVLESLYQSLIDGNYDEKMWHELTGQSYIVLKDLYHDLYKDRNDVTVIDEEKEVVSIGFAGDVSLADNWAIMPYYKSRNKGVYGILSENMVNYMDSLDWMIVNSEFAFSNRGTAMNNKQYTFRANPNNVNIYDEMNVDMVTLANNHVYDYGKEAFLDTLDTFKNKNLPYIGAGVNNNEAEAAYYLVINGYKIAFLNATRAEKYILTPEATVEQPGVFRCYDPTRLVERIKEEKENSDYVVVIIHWGKETYHELENVQKETGKLYIDNGADMVIGHHAHVLQGMEFYKGKLIAYNLGNFIFNSLTVDTGILKWQLSGDGESQFYFYPGIQSNCYTSEVIGDKASNLYNKMTNWSINASFLEDGKIIEK